ncbi:MAG: glycerol kinase GlpK [Lachnospiraceae bacterium]|nr:glycerol kinase GlpK [Lachnospiraceae bacterium]MDD4525189.1 glycerol kinase GlpK [Lachnospiraceae bacterium]
MDGYIMALDQGTTSSRCILFDHSGKICSIAQKEFPQYFPQPGWVEHDPMEIWSSQFAVAMEAMAQIGVTATGIAGIGITNQRETTILWDRKTGKPIYNAIVWQCRRTADMIDALSDEQKKEIRGKTGLVPDAYFSATKIAWILDHVKGARQQAGNGEICFGNVDSWLIWNLTKGGVHITDYTNASRTMLFNIHEMKWDDELLEMFNIPREILPEARPSSMIYGYTDPAILGGRIPIAAAAGDQQSALFGQCCFEPGEVKNTYGTGGFLLMNTGHEAIESAHGLLTTVAATPEGEETSYALEGSVFVAGSSIQWLRDEMRMVKTAAQSEEYADEVYDTAGVYVVPAFTGLGAPYWNPYARGTIVGLTRGCKKEHFIRATLESICYQSMDVITAMEEDAGVPLTGLKVDGGASANNFLMKFQANLMNTQVFRPKCIETTALGAAYLAGMAVGYWKDRDEIKENWQLGRTFTPELDDKTRNELMKGWHRAVRCAISWADDED